LAVSARSVGRGEQVEQRIYSTGWLVLLSIVYSVHLVDERYYSIGTADFATQYLGIYFTNAAWWAVNIPSIILFTLAAALVARGTWPQWVVLALAVHLALHGLGRVPTSLWTLEIAPGLVTGLLLCTPVAAASFWRGRGVLSRSQVLRGLVAGAASFQPFWHFALLPFLPGPPPAV
jgi:hypothetical protein